jgi:hypothetical protein
MRGKVGFLLVAMLISLKTGLCQVSSATLQTVFLYQSIKYLEWPADDLANFEMLIVGDREIYNESQKIAESRKVGNRPIVVKQIEKITAPPLCHIVYFTESVQVTSILSFIEKGPILLVTNTEGLLEEGSDLNFICRGDKLFYQLNTSSLHEKKIKVSTTFSSMAEKII